MALHPTIAAVTDGIIKRSGPVRARYLQLMDEQSDRGVTRSTMSCGNFAHGLAASEGDKPAIRGNRAINIGIVSAYNDMLSAQAPDGRYPEQMKLFAREVGATAPVAGGVPATGDADTQGLAGVELSLFSRDTIVRSTAVALSPGMFEAKALLGNRDPAAIQASPEALGGGPLARVRDGDLRVSADTGELNALVDPAEWEARDSTPAPAAALGTGRELFAMFRHGADEAEKGASAMLAAMEELA
jgi:dihydroxyacid dehydratase/phosphogluconate dehydratase